MKFKLITCFILQLTLWFTCLQGEVEKLVIIGAGPAGASAAIFAGQSHLNPVVIRDDNCKTQMAFIHKIDNYPGVLDETDGLELLNNFYVQAEKFGARFVDGSLKNIDLLNRPFTIELESGETFQAEAVIIAAGTDKKWLGAENEQHFRKNGVVSGSLCLGNSYHGKNIVVVGGGHAALQEAQYVSEKANQVFLLNRSDKFNASKLHRDQVLNNEKVKVIYHTEVVEILDPKQNKVTEVVARNNITKEEVTLPADIVIVAIGNNPNTEMIKDQLKTLPTGHIVINGKNTSTSIPGVFAAGDITDVSYGRVVIAAGSGAMAALDAIRYLDSLSKKQ